MKVLTYFGFTLLSIFIQIGVMDFIQNKLLLDEDKGIYPNLTSPKIRLSDILKDLKSMPHALYYHSQQNNDVDTHGLKKKTYRNTLLPDKQQSSTDTSSTIFDIFLYENSSITETIFTTDSVYTSAEIDNVTEVTFFLSNNGTNKIDQIPLIKYNSDCNCNLLYEICDINCCCDSNCDNTHKTMFNCMDSHKQRTNKISDFCISHIMHNGKPYGNILDNMFCIVKINLPKKRNIITNKFDNTTADYQYFKWQRSKKPRHLKEFSKTLYKIGDPVWLLRNKTIYHVDLPTSVVNTYCTGRKPITFLKDEVVNCNVKYRDLEMFRIYKTAEDSAIISAKDVTANSTALNCSSLHCTNWTIIVCDGVNCIFYNKTMHEPLCNEHICTNIALTIDYVLNYYDSKIVNVSVTLHIRNMSSPLWFISQILSVKFLLGNKTDDQIIEFSGSPGYKRGLMIVASSMEANYTDHFYQCKITKEQYFSLPFNENGHCVLPNFKRNFVQFGLNKRIKCRYFHNHSLPYKKVNVCKDIQGNISELFNFNNKIVISPQGNPYNLKDKDWIRLRLDGLDKKPVYGKIDNSLHCYNVISKISLTFFL